MHNQLAQYFYITWCFDVSSQLIVEPQVFCLDFWTRDMFFLAFTWSWWDNGTKLWVAFDFEVIVTEQELVMWVETSFSQATIFTHHIQDLWLFHDETERHEFLVPDLSAIGFCSPGDYRASWNFRQTEPVAGRGLNEFGSRDHEIWPKVVEEAKAHFLHFLVVAFSCISSRLEDRDSHLWCKHRRCFLEMFPSTNQKPALFPHPTVSCLSFCLLYPQPTSFARTLGIYIRFQYLSMNTFWQPAGFRKRLVGCRQLLPCDHLALHQATGYNQKGPRLFLWTFLDWLKHIKTY